MEEWAYTTEPMQIPQKGAAEEGADAWLDPTMLTMMLDLSSDDMDAEEITGVDAVAGSTLPLASGAPVPVNCPLCHRLRLDPKEEMVIVTHLAICASGSWNKMDIIVMGNLSRRFRRKESSIRRWLGGWRWRL
ncbi:hypothetical protein CVT25_015184 [Psilocybe cyanescens]|uniref:Uncharacterized protein n=1 Tax=Psilocybe cyanescens TaxID=93625 RepID=A0A409VZA2_PSICY|nr:hypothetical protein CVT25_015184 [Psilocybe cyanescens]